MRFILLSLCVGLVLVVPVQARTVNPFVSNQSYDFKNPSQLESGFELARLQPNKVLRGNKVRGGGNSYIRHTRSVALRNKSNSGVMRRNGANQVTKSNNERYTVRFRANGE